MNARAYYVLSGVRMFIEDVTAETVMGCRNMAPVPIERCRAAARLFAGFGYGVATIEDETGLTVESWEADGDGLRCTQYAASLNESDSRDAMRAALDDIRKATADGPPDCDVVALQRAEDTLVRALGSDWRDVPAACEKNRADPFGMTLPGEPPVGDEDDHDDDS